MRSCSDCPKRAKCRSICPEIERQLPPEDGRPRAGLNAIDRALVWSIQDMERRLPERQRRAARLHFRLGLSQAEVARRMGVSQQAVSEMLLSVRKKLRLGVVKTA